MPKFKNSNVTFLGNFQTLCITFRWWQRSILLARRITGQVIFCKLAKSSKISLATWKETRSVSEYMTIIASQLFNWLSNSACKKEEEKKVKWNLKPKSVIVWDKWRADNRQLLSCVVKQRQTHTKKTFFLSQFMECL